MGKNANTPPIVPIQTAIGATAAAAATVVVTDPIQHFVALVSSSPWLAGICYIIVNLAGKHIAMNLTPEQEKSLGSVWLRPIIIFCLCFVATRNIITAFWLTTAFMLIFYVIFYEASPLCLLRVIPKDQEQAPSTATQPAATQAAPSQPAATQPAATQPHPSMVPLFMKGPIALPDPNVAKEEANYIKNMGMM